METASGRLCEPLGPKGKSDGGASQPMQVLFLLAIDSLRLTTFSRGEMFLKSQDLPCTFPKLRDAQGFRRRVTKDGRLCRVHAELKTVVGSPRRL
ncbi:MAG: hypothetical protein CMJ75_20420 [Planctomycetaceae bacterium]|nr:hypothetical protein [Planctomycetaceae bacterium]